MDILNEKNEKMYLGGKYSVIGCVRIIVMSFFLTYLTVETWVIATRYPVPKTGNAAHHYSLYNIQLTTLCIKRERYRGASLQSKFTSTHPVTYQSHKFYSNTIK